MDIDWDDDDEQTTVFDRQHEDPARALLHSNPPAAPIPAAGAPSGPTAPGLPRIGGAGALASSPAASRPQVRPPTPPAPVPMPMPVPVAAPPAPAPIQFEVPPARGSRAMLVLSVLAVIAVIAVIVVVLMPKTGTLVVTVVGPGNKSVDSLQVYVDDQKKCEASPCKVADLSKGSHFVRVTAAGYQPTAAQVVKIVAGDETPLNVPLTHASEGTGIRVTAEGSGLKLLVDGKEIGPLPQEIKDMSPGEHKIVVTGLDPHRYDKWEKTVTVEADKMIEVAPKVKVLEGLVTITAGDNADDAKIALVSGRERRPIPRLPIKLTLPDPDKSYSIVATKKGFNTYNQPIAFDDGQGEKSFTVSLTPEGEAPTPPAPEATPRAPRGGTTPAPAPKTPTSTPAPTPPAATGDAKLNINSIPVSNVILDGRPLGPTPKIGVSVKPGPHTVMFVHAELGRKVKSVNVAAGGTATVTAKFP